MVSVSGDVLLVMGGEGDGPRYLNDVQIFDGWTWRMDHHFLGHVGPCLQWSTETWCL